MRVLINAASAHMGGSLTYLQNVLRWLPQMAPAAQFITYVPEATLEKLERLDGEGVQLRPYPYASTQGLRRIYFDQVEIPRIARREATDVLFSSTGFGTLLSPSPEVLLIRNPRYFNRTFEETYRNLGRSLLRTRLRRWYSLLCARWADAVLFPTRAMQGMVEQHADLSAKRTEAIHYGFDHDTFSDQNGHEPRLEEIDDWKKRGYKILLNVSTYAIHKNLETSIDALAHLKEDNYNVKLITTTSRKHANRYREEYDDMKRRATDLGVVADWLELGYVNYDALRALYKRGDVYVFPSFAESFGHSLVEAMAAGLPVVASNTQVNQEVCRRAGRYFPTFDARACATQIESVLSDSKEQECMHQQSLERAKDFSWKKYAKELVSIFEEWTSR